MQSKKQLILWILNILNTETDKNRPLTQTKIADIISDVYPCDRKTVCRNIKFLKEMGYPIKKTSRGYYIDDKVFSLDEIAFIKNAIITANGRSEAEKNEIAEKVVATLTKFYKRRC